MTDASVLLFLFLFFFPRKSAGEAKERPGLQDGMRAFNALYLCGGEKKNKKAIMHPCSVIVWHILRYPSVIASEGNVKTAVWPSLYSLILRKKKKEKLATQKAFKKLSNNEMRAQILPRAFPFLPHYTRGPKKHSLFSLEKRNTLEGES
jgi:hypothetical protein